MIVSQYLQFSFLLFIYLTGISDIFRIKPILVENSKANTIFSLVSTLSPTTLKKTAVLLEFLQIFQQFPTIICRNRCENIINQQYIVKDTSTIKPQPKTAKSIKFFLFV